MKLSDHDIRELYELVTIDSDEAFARKDSIRATIHLCKEVLAARAMRDGLVGGMGRHKIDWDAVAAYDKIRNGDDE